MAALAHNAVMPWERQDNESSQAFEAFDTYLKMGADRSLAKAAQSLLKSTTLLAEWSRHHAWQERVRSWERHESRRTNEEVFNGTAGMRKRQAQMGIALQNLVVKRLQTLKDEDIAKLPIGQLLQLQRIGGDTELKARNIKAEELESHERFDTPMFTIEFLPAKPPQMALMRLPDGQTGYIPEDRVSEFMQENPEATVVLQ